MTNRIINESFGPTIRTDKLSQRESVAVVIAAIEAEKPYIFCDAIEGLAYTDAWRDAFLAIRKKANPSMAFRLEMGGLWALHGAMIRNALNDDLLLADALRKILPPYSGGDMTLYRGEGFENRCKRAYGLCWTSEEPVARYFAKDRASDYPAGTVLLRAEVPKASIVASIHDLDPENGEFEYLVDRRFLKPAMIRVLERLPFTARPVFRLADFLPK
ncbi:hypothetical protein [Rhizobium leguminosarum]|uniref:hypothetical protein n=1 Tax=Rhizobium leguminosarum TaxID=384 RepID=UPI0010E3170C|nr:hypothetical protein [Rhizobium leguminosarum]TBH09917.1 hypothetical protein ELG68_01405 [Rhizobium leguminosarum]